MVLFIEGISRNEHLKKDLHLKKCTTLDEATREAVYLVDNCQIYGEASKDSETPSLDSRSTSSDNKSIKSNQSQPAMDAEKLADELMKRLNQNVRLQNQRILPMRWCMTCGGDHPTHQCPALPQQVPRQKWCAIEGKYTNHTIEECYYNRGQVKERPYQVNLQYQPNVATNPQYGLNRTGPPPQDHHHQDTHQV